MLKRLTIVASATGALIAGSFLIVSPAVADQVVCPPDDDCYVVVETPGTPGGGGGSGGGDGGEQVCRDPKGNVLECYTPGKGWWDPVNSCYWKRHDPQPPASDPIWGSNQPADGAIYHLLCPFSSSWFGRDGDYFQATPPAGYGGLPSAATLAARAVNNLPIRGPQIRTAPDAAGAGLVSLPVWLWTDVNATTWGPQTATASVPGLTVTATARAIRIEWRMGDGGSVICNNPGTPYDRSLGAINSPTCSYAYGNAGRYTITGVTTWQVDWAGGGQNGSLTVTRQSTSTLTINELQVVTR